VGQEEDEPRPPEEQSLPADEGHDKEAREDEAFRAKLRHYSRRARLFKS
jgi:hypothetical protein